MRNPALIFLAIVLFYSCQEVMVNDNGSNLYIEKGIIDTVPDNDIVDGLQKKLISGEADEDSVLIELAKCHAVNNHKILKKIAGYIVEKNGENGPFSDHAYILLSFVYAENNDTDSCDLYLGKIDSSNSLYIAYNEGVSGFLMRDKDSTAAKEMLSGSCKKAENILDFGDKYGVKNKEFPEYITFLCFYLRSIFIDGSTDSIAIYESTAGLERLAGKAKNPVVRIHSLMRLGYRAYRTGKTEKAIEYFSKCATDFKAINDNNLLSNNYNNIGVLYYHQGNNEKALEYYNMALEISRETKDERATAKMLNNIAVIYDISGKTKEAISTYLEALKIREQVRDSAGMSLIYNNLGIIFDNLSDSIKALEYYKKSRVIDEKQNDLEALSYTYDNLSSAYSKRGMRDSALYYIRQCLSIREKIGDVLQLPPSYNNMGTMMLEMNKPDSALYFYHLALKYADDNGDMNDIITARTNIGRYYFEQKDYKKAREIATDAYVMSGEIDYPELVRDAASLLSDIYNRTGDVKQELKYLREYINLRDSLSSQQNKQLLQQRYYQYEYDKKAIEDSILYEQKILVKNSEITRIEEKNRSQQMIIYLIIGIAAIVAVFLFIIIRQVSIKKKINKTLLLRNSEINSKNELLESQKRELQIKNRQIGDSFDYAKNLQLSILPSEEMLKQYAEEHFLLFMPKETIGGDFYWAAEGKKSIYLAVADCTGHGIPGAILSTMSIILLNNIVSDQTDLSPGEILIRLNADFLKCLNNQGDLITNDGLDITLLKIDKNAKQIVAVSTNQSLFVAVPAEKLRKYNGDIVSIGGFMATDYREILTEHVFTYTPGTIIYMMTDGFADQLGGDENKKYSNKELEHLIEQLMTSVFQHQPDTLKDEHLAWKGGQKQTDDITFMAVML